MSPMNTAPPSICLGISDGRPVLRSKPNACRRCFTPCINMLRASVAKRFNLPVSILYILFEFGEYITELSIINYDTIIEVEANLIVGYYMQTIMIFTALCNLLDDAIQLLALTR